MGARFPSVVSTTFVGPLPANATETVVILSPPFSPSIDSSLVMIQWFFSYQAGVANNFAQYRLRRGTTAASTLLNAGTWAFTTAAGATSTGSGVYVDQLAGLAGQQYALTLIQGNATGPGTFQDACLLVFSL